MSVISNVLSRLKNLKPTRGSNRWRGNTCRGFCRKWLAIAGPTQSSQIPADPRRSGRPPPQGQPPATEEQQERTPRPPPWGCLWWRKKPFFQNAWERKLLLYWSLAFHPHTYTREGDMRTLLKVIRVVMIKMYIFFVFVLFFLPKYD